MARIQPVRNALRRRLIESAVAKGYAEKDATALLKKAEAEFSIWDLFMSEGFAALVKFFLSLFGFAGIQPANAPTEGEGDATGGFVGEYPPAGAPSTPDGDETPPADRQ